MRAYKFLCKLCLRSKRDQPGYTICERCVSDESEINKLADLIRRTLPQHEWAPTPAIMARLWLSYLMSHRPKDTAALKAAREILARLRKGEQLQLLR